MNATENTPQILATFESVRRFSFEQKRQAAYSEQAVNAFLDAVLDFKSMLADKTAKINDIVTRVEAITWLQLTDNETLMLVNDLVSQLKDLRSSLVRQYLSLDFLRKKGVAKTEIKAFKASIDDLLDVAADLESRFFYLPKIEGFEETSRELSLL